MVSLPLLIHYVTTKIISGVALLKRCPSATACLVTDGKLRCIWNLRSHRQRKRHRGVVHQLFLNHPNLFVLLEIFSSTVLIICFILSIWRDFVFYYVQVGTIWTECTHLTSPRLYAELDPYNCNPSNDLVFLITQMSFCFVYFGIVFVTILCILVTILLKLT